MVGALNMLDNVSWSIDDMFVYAAYEGIPLNITYVNEREAISSRKFFCCTQKFSTEFTPSGNPDTGRCYTFNSLTSEKIWDLTSSGTLNGTQHLHIFEQKKDHCVSRTCYC